MFPVSSKSSEVMLNEELESNSTRNELAYCAYSCGERDGRAEGMSIGIFCGLALSTFAFIVNIALSMKKKEKKEGKIKS